MDNYTGCIMVDFDLPNWKTLTDIVSPDDLLNKYGLSKYPHVTILYGLNSSVTPMDTLNSAYRLMPSSISVKPLRLSLFENDDCDVLKIEIEGKILYDLHEIIKQNFDYRTDFDKYNPHMTIAYLKSGTGKKYIKELNTNAVWNSSHYTYTYTGDDGKKYKGTFSK